MQIKYIFAVALVALFAVPGTASQLAARSAMSAPFAGLPAATAASRGFDDPNLAPSLSIELPTRFVAADIEAQPLEQFRG
jgi:hypothetical protein